jgi:RNA exonuclease 4
MCSGIRPEDLEGAPSFETVRDKVESLLADKLLVGHALHHDLEVPVL